MLSQEQINARQQGIGGSDAPVIAGISPYKSVLQLYLEKRGEIELSQEESEAMYWGSVLEPTIANTYQERTGRKIRRQPTKVHTRYPWMLANIDRQILDVPTRGGTGALEIKTTNAWSTQWTNGPDDSAYLQVQHYLAVTGYGWGSIAVLIGGQVFKYWDVERDEKTIELLIGLEGDFWDRVRSGVPPSADGSESSRQALKTMYPTDTGASITLDDDEARRRASVLQSTKDIKKAAEATILEHENWFKGRIGAHAMCHIPGWGGMTWKADRTSIKTILDEAKLQQDHPAIYAMCLKDIPTGGTRRFLTKPEKKKGA